MITIKIVFSCVYRLSAKKILVNLQSRKPELQLSSPCAHRFELNNLIAS